MGHVQRARDYSAFAIRKVLGRHDPLIPPPWLHSVGGGDYRSVAIGSVERFKQLCDLKPTERILDVGAGTGRIAYGLLPYLTTGSYDGLEIVKPSVEWCRRAYAGHPNFRFHHADVFNGHYNPSGVPAAEYRFPFADDASFDFIFLTSVFTHMMPADVANYLHEIRRVLVPGGRVFMTAFLLNPDTQTLIDQGKSRFTFRHRFDGCFSEFPEIPERAIAYEEPDMSRLIEESGLHVSGIYHGTWRGVAGIDFQDIITID